MKKLTVILAAFTLLLGILTSAQVAQAATRYADCFSASGSLSFSKTEYVVEILNYCMFDDEIPLGARAMYRVDFGFGGSCASTNTGNLLMSSFGPTVRIRVACLNPGTYRPQIVFQSFADGSSNFDYLSNFSIVAPSPTPSPKPTPTPSRSPSQAPLVVPTQEPAPVVPAIPTPGDDWSAWEDDEPYGLYSRGGKGRLCVKFPDGDEDNECIDGNHWSYLTCYGSAKGLKLQVLKNGKWKDLTGRFTKKDGCDGYGYDWTVDVHAKEKTSGTQKYRIINPAQAGFKQNITRLTVTYRK